MKKNRQNLNTQNESENSCVWNLIFFCYSFFSLSLYIQSEHNDSEILNFRISTTTNAIAHTGIAYTHMIHSEKNAKFTSFFFGL